MQAVKPSQEVLAQYAEACERYPQHADHPGALVKVDEQRLYVLEEGACQVSYPVSTSRYGTGEEQDSCKTPRGVHCVAEKIGGDAGVAEIFRSRKRTHQIAEIESGETRTDQEHITTRILWLAGLEEGVNQGGGVDSHGRYIYIHGTHEEGLIGQPASIGCVRMKNLDVMDLYDRLEVSSLVIISE
ncbi:MAG: L,D-transpeptidase [Proteobacteria bacterium]|nr:L,D-transpeptidase [Pseudomonadota bacterium]